MTDAQKSGLEPKCGLLPRLTDNGDGAVWFELSTRYSLDEALKPGFFRHVGRHGLRRLDRIEVATDNDTDEPTIATLVVTSVKAGAAEVVLRKGSKQTISCAPRGPFEALGILPNASVNDIEAAYRARANEAHPDKPGGTAEKFRAVELAREQCLVIAENRAA